ncbi:SdiA-regulated domain-containing protein, partial [Haematobacter missouriensis]|uniref:SdiA-regulated domain-containing protein n=1 Tax=Haematobacter missouriensis TaxID=366616 RepID=UPI001B80543F
MASTSSWLWMSGLGGVAFQLLDQRRAEETEGSIWLPAYSAAVQGVQVSGLRDNLSGLTFNLQIPRLSGQ